MKTLSICVCFLFACGCSAQPQESSKQTDHQKALDAIAKQHTQPPIEQADTTETEIERKIKILEKMDWTKIKEESDKQILAQKVEAKREIPRLILNLQNSKDALERYSVIRALLEYGDDSVEPLVAALDDKDPFVRGFSAFGLRMLAKDRYTNPKAVGPLIQHLTDKGIFNFGGRKENLTDEGPLYVAQVAATALVYYNDQSALPHIKKALVEAKEQLEISNKQHDEISRPIKYLANSGLVKDLEKAIKKLENNDGG